MAPVGKHTFMKMSAPEVALYVFLLGAAISFAIAALIQGAFWVIRRTRRLSRAEKAEPGMAPGESR